MPPPWMMMPPPEIMAKIMKEQELMDKEARKGELNVVHEKSTADIIDEVLKDADEEEKKTEQAKKVI